MHSDSLGTIIMERETSSVAPAVHLCTWTSMWDGSHFVWSLSACPTCPESPVWLALEMVLLALLVNYRHSVSL